MYPLDEAVEQTSRVGVEGGIFSVERGLLQREIEVVGYPCGEVFGGEQMGFFVLIVLAPALREGLDLFLLREPCDEVGVTGRDALRLERLGYLGISCSRARRA